MLKEVQRKTRLDKDQIQRLIDFLKEYNFIAVDETKKKIKLGEAVQEFLTRTPTS